MTDASPGLIANAAGSRQPQDAFELLVEQHYRPTLRLAYRMLGDWHDAEDLAQEVLLKAYLHVDRLRHQAALGAWLARVTRNAALDLLAARRRRPATLSLGDDKNGELAPALTSLAGPSAEEESERAELWHTLRAGLDRISPDKGAALVLHDVYGYTYHEIAGRYAIGISAVKMRIARARRMMRKSLGEG